MRARLSLNGRGRSILVLALFAGIVGYAGYSWFSGGIIRVLPDGAGSLGDNEASLDALRQALLRWGPLAPLVYVAAVVVEVLVAPIPGTLLYAPAGALFGGFQGGVLSLIGNTIGAAVACAVGRTLGEEAVKAGKLAGAVLITDRDPRYPQRFAEIMGGRIALAEDDAVIPKSLKFAVIGALTASEINLSE